MSCMLPNQQNVEKSLGLFNIFYFLLLCFNCFNSFSQNVSISMQFVVLDVISVSRNFNLENTTNGTYTIFHQVTCLQKFVLYLMSCMLPNYQNVEKVEAIPNIMISNPKNMLRIQTQYWYADVLTKAILIEKDTQN